MVVIHPPLFFSINYGIFFSSKKSQMARPMAFGALSGTRRTAWSAFCLVGLAVLVTISAAEEVGGQLQDTGAPHYPPYPTAGVVGASVAVVAAQALSWFACGEAV